jgi:hypothetical protein
MNKMIAGLFAAALVSAPAFADVGAPAPTAKDMEKMVDKVNYVETAKEGIKLSGYVDVGYTYNFQGSTGAFGKSGGATGVDRTSRGDFNLNAVKLTLEKPLTSANEFQAGFRADVKFGEDATLLGGNTSAAGSSDNFSVDQAYVIIRAPIGNGLDITAGKFASLLGYEVDDRPANLNITYGYDYFFVTTHQTGVKFYYPVNDTIELQLAVSNGSGIDTNSIGAGGTAGTDTDGYGVSATVNIKNSGGNANLFNGVYVSKGTADGFTNDGAAFMWNTWGNWAPKFANDKLLLGFSSTLGDTPDSTNGTSNSEDGFTYWTGSLYTKYQVTDIFSLAGRASYLHAADPAALAATSTTTALTGPNGDAWSWTGTAGFDLLENLLLRAEYRVDLFDGNGRDAATEFAGDTAQTISLQAVYTF